MQDEHRKVARHRVLKGAMIAFGGGAGIDCTVRNLSDHGAALDVVSPIGIPDEFTLVTRAGDFERPCRVAWRKEKRLGIVFTG